MPKIRNVSGEARIVPWLGGRVVDVDEVVDVPDADPYTSQENVWAAVGGPAKKGDD